MLRQYPQVLITPTGYRLAKRRTVRLKDLQDEAEGWELLVHFVRLGVGPAVVNGSVRTTGAVRKIPVRDRPPVRYYVVTRKDRSDAVKELRGMLR